MRIPTLPSTHTPSTLHLHSSQELVKGSEVNRQSLQAVDSSLLVVCLDDAHPVDEVDVTHRMLHNYGANRQATHMQHGRVW